MFNDLTIFKLSSLFNFILILMTIKHFCIYKSTILLQSRIFKRFNKLLECFNSNI